MPPILRLLRPLQWVKSAFVAAPLFFNAPLWSAQTLALVAWGMAAFCLMASAVYVLNDLMDREADREHAVKRLRPLASGEVSPSLAYVLILVLLVIALEIATWLGGLFPVFLLSYGAIQLLYCFWLKNHALIDVMTIAIGFVLRVLAGAALIDVTPTSWIIIMTMLLALFQGLAKRRDDLVHAMEVSHRRSLVGYNKPFLDVAISVILGGLLVAYLIFTTDAAVIERFGTENLFYTAPLVILGILRYLQITLVEEKSGSPTEVVLRDKFMIFSILGWVVSFFVVPHV
ncbi:MAG: UbiA prenyltransferase family protein [Bdellovibrionales bacterium]|jgi:4-hydroxybenzoate polyprenyltransferase